MMTQYIQALSMHRRLWMAKILVTLVVVAYLAYGICVVLGDWSLKHVGIAGVLMTTVPLGALLACGVIIKRLRSIVLEVSAAQAPLDPSDVRCYLKVLTGKQSVRIIDDSRLVGQLGKEGCLDQLKSEGIAHIEWAKCGTASSGDSKFMVAIKRTGDERTHLIPIMLYPRGAGISTPFLSLVINLVSDTPVAGVSLDRYIGPEARTLEESYEKLVEISRIAIHRVREDRSLEAKWGEAHPQDLA